jgi:hypothetical protein
LAFAERCHFQGERLHKFLLPYFGHLGETQLVEQLHKRLRAVAARLPQLVTRSRGDGGNGNVRRMADLIDAPIIAQRGLKHPARDKVKGGVLRKSQRGTTKQLFVATAKAAPNFLSNIISRQAAWTSPSPQTVLTAGSAWAWARAFIAARSADFDAVNTPPTGLQGGWVGTLLPTNAIVRDHTGRFRLSLGSLGWAALAVDVDAETKNGQITALRLTDRVGWWPVADTDPWQSWQVVGARPQLVEGSITLAPTDETSPVLTHLLLSPDVKRLRDAQLRHLALLLKVSLAGCKTAVDRLAQIARTALSPEDAEKSLALYGDSSVIAVTPLMEDVARHLGDDGRELLDRLDDRRRASFAGAVKAARAARVATALTAKSIGKRKMPLAKVKRLTRVTRGGTYAELRTHCAQTHFRVCVHIRDDM